MLDRFLIDECLTQDLVALAHVRGHDATHIVFRSLQGTSDDDLMPIILNENFVFVTNNGKDFLSLYGNENLHPGLIIILPGSQGRVIQARLFEKVLDVIEPLSDIINKVVRVDINGNVTIEDYPPSSAPPPGGRHRP